MSFDPPPSAAETTSPRPRFAPSSTEGGALAWLAAPLLIAAAIAVREAPDPTPRRPVAYRLNVNAATPAEWSLMRGVGPVLADRIAEDRTHRGPFRAPADLLAVRGMGPKTFARLRPHLQFPGDPVPTDGPVVATR